MVLAPVFIIFGGVINSRSSLWHKHYSYVSVIEMSKIIRRNNSLLFFILYSTIDVSNILVSFIPQNVETGPLISKVATRELISSGKQSNSINFKPNLDCIHITNLSSVRY
jgi:hypothetical protein